MNENLLKQLEATVTDGCILRDEPLKNHTTFRIGGPADVFVIPGSIKEAEEVIRLLCVYNEPFTVLGNGSNVLVSDKGIRGVVVCIMKGCDIIEVNGEVITAGAGAALGKIAASARDNSLTGLEFASGIPGTLGGAIVMNAGAYGGEMCQVVTDVTMFDISNQKLVTLSAKEMDFSYRHSVVKDYPYIVLSVNMKLSQGDRDEIRKTMDELNGKRRDKQPLEYPSAGSTFKRPEGYFAGKLIEDAGLKGYSVNGAQVSVKHSGFVINTGDATAEDVLTLIRNVRADVIDKFGVELEPEVCLIGEDIHL